MARDATSSGRPKATSPSRKHASHPKRVSRHQQTGSGDHDSTFDELPSAAAYSQHAARIAQGEILVPPRLLTDYDRRSHIRRTLIEDHRYRLRNRPESMQDKFKVMAESAFRFFRGTALLYYRDYAGTDAGLPVVLCLGDVHPKNFGVMPSADGTPVFGPNDFDEAHFAPFSYDVKRGAAGFDLAAREAGFKRKQRGKIVGRFGDAYVESLQEFASGDHEADLSMRIDNSPPMVRKLLEASRKDRSQWLLQMIDLEKGEFRPTDEIVPLSSRVEDFRRAIGDYRTTNDLGQVTRLTNFNVKDVALKKGSGTASLGLDRYFVLIDGPTDSVADDLVLEMKQARPSALAGLVPNRSPGSKSEADRVITAHRVHVSGGDPYYGTATLDGTSFLVRERSPFKNSIDLEDLDADGWAEYAVVCGRTLALAHARSDADTGIQKGEAEHAILDAITPRVFMHDVIDFAADAAKKAFDDWRLFREDFERGIFEPR